MPATPAPSRYKPKPIGGGVWSVELTLGKFAVFDEADLPLITGRAWVSHKSGANWYARAADGKAYMHRVIAGAPRSVRVDHRDCDGLNNRRENLRAATASSNGANSRLPKSNTSGFKGARYFKPTGRWMAQIMVNRKAIYLGYFDKPEQAARAYDAAAVEHFGEFARLNFPPSKQQAA